MFSAKVGSLWNLSTTDLCGILSRFSTRLSGFSTLEIEPSNILSDLLDELTSMIDHVLGKRCYPGWVQSIINLFVAIRRGLLTKEGNSKQLWVYVSPTASFCRREGQFRSRRQKITRRRRQGARSSIILMIYLITDADMQFVKCFTTVTFPWFWFFPRKTLNILCFTSSPSFGADQNWFRRVPVEGRVRWTQVNTMPLLPPSFVSKAQ